MASEALADDLAALPDLERLDSKAAQKSISPREAIAIAAAARRLPEIARRLPKDGAGQAGDPVRLLAEIHGQIGDFAELAERIEQTVEDPPPASFGEGVIRRGCHPELDEVRALAGDAKAWIADLER